MPHIKILATMPILIRKEPGESFPELLPLRSFEEMEGGRAHRRDRKVEHEPLLPSIQLHRFSKGECVILNRLLRLILAAIVVEVTANGLKQLFAVLSG